MPITRREFIAGLGALTGIRLLSPIVVRAGDAVGQTLPDPDAALRARVVVVFLQGGNDGLNTVVPMADVDATLGGARRSIYEKVRPSIKYAPSALLALDRNDDGIHALGLNPRLSTLHSLYRSDRVAIVQGVDYPAHSFSHFVSTDIWESGIPEFPQTGWLGRHLDREPAGDGELRGLGVGRELPLILQGNVSQGVEVESIAATRFADGTGLVGDPRHDALRRYADHSPAEPLRAFAGHQARQTVELVEALESIAAPPKTANNLANALLTARTLLAGPFGVECVFVSQGGYDTHTSQVAAHEQLLTTLDRALEAFFFGSLAGAPIGVGPLPSSLAERTIVLTISEFGRRIGENGTGTVAGTDHGAAAPLFIVGPPAGATATGARLTPGLHGAHPEMGSVTLPADNLKQTTELRRIYQAVLQGWIGDPDPRYEGAYEPLPGLFAPVP